MAKRNLDEETVKAFEHLLSKRLITSVDVIKKVYTLGFDEGYSVSDSVKNKEMQIIAMGKQGR